MIRKKFQNIEWLEFEQLQELLHVKAATFLRHGGVSFGDSGSLNVGKEVGDPVQNVEENLKRMKSCFAEGRLYIPSQVHGTNLEVVKGDLLPDRGCDGLLTKHKNNVLMIKHADCQATLFYDPIQNVLAHVHCGWRGNVQNIYQHTIDALKKFGSCPENLLVCISPSLGSKRSEFIHFEKEFPAHFQEFQWKENYFNLWEISRMQLKRAGVLDSHIECAEICTYENEQDFFSYRRDKLEGRHASFAMLI